MRINPPPPPAHPGAPGAAGTSGIPCLWNAAGTRHRETPTDPAGLRSRRGEFPLPAALPEFLRVPRSLIPAEEFFFGRREKDRESSGSRLGGRDPPAPGPDPGWNLSSRLRSRLESAPGTLRIIPGIPKSRQRLRSLPCGCGSRPCLSFPAGSAGINAWKTKGRGRI